MPHVKGYPGDPDEDDEVSRWLEIPGGVDKVLHIVSANNAAVSAEKIAEIFTDVRKEIRPAFTKLNSGYFDLAMKFRGFAGPH